MLRTAILTALAVCHALVLYGQVQMPAASAAAFAYGKYADIPVNTFTGTGNVQVPIHTVTDGPLALPISLNYHTGGLQMNVPSSSPGWGWNLNAGGIISRSIKGTDDFNKDHGYFYHGSDVRYPTGPDDAVYADDTEPDIYFYTVGAISGKFFFDANREVQLVPKSDIQVRYTVIDSEYAPGIANFTLVTPDGIEYTYGIDYGRSEPGTVVPEAYDYAAVDEEVTKSAKHRTGWHLMTVEDPVKQHRINLEYTPVEYNYVTHKPCPQEFKYRTTGGNIRTAPNPDCERGAGLYTTYFVNSQIIKRIWTDKEEVTFNNSRRYDLSDNSEGTKPPLRTHSIEIAEGQTCIKYDLLISYFYNAGQYARTKLDGVQRTSCSGSITEPAWTFTYLGSANSVPGTGSHDIDHWGYNNYDPVKGYNDPNGDLTPQGTGMIIGGEFTPYGTANREPYEPAMLQGMLEKVRYPTGGSLSLEYEANRYQVAGSARTESIGNSTSPAGAPEAPQTYSFTYRPEIANSTSVNWQLCIDGFGSGTSGGGTQLDPTYGSDPNTSFGTGSGHVEVRTSSGTLIDGFGFNTDGSTSNECLPFLFGQSKYTVGAEYSITVFAEEAHVSLSIAYVGEPGEAIGGGLRIKTTKVHDGLSSSRDIITNYDYVDQSYPTVSSGKLFRKPKYAFKVNDRTAVFTSMSQVPLFELDGIHIAYDRVVVSQSGNGETEYLYDLPTEQVDYISYPVRPTTNRLGVGALRESNVYDEDGATVAQNSTSYREDQTKSFGASSATGYFFVKSPGTPYYTGSYGTRNLYTPYLMRTGVHRPRAVTSTVDGVTTTTEYTYQTNNLLPKTVTTQNSDGSEYRQEFDFIDADNLPFTDISPTEWDRLNLVHLLAETRLYHNNAQIDGQRTDYRFYQADGTSPSTSANGRVKMPRVFTNSRYIITYSEDNNLGSGSWEEQSRVLEYNGSFGQVRRVQDKGWPVRSISYRGQLPIATTMTGSGQTTEYKYYGEETLISEDDTRQLERVIHIDGTSTSYTYDDIGRVKTITDDCQEITATHSYTFRYDNQNISFFQTEVNYPSTDNRSGFNTIRTREFLDGLGRPLQTISVGAGQSAQDDIVNGVVYDRYGRVSKAYEPMGKPNNQGEYVSLVSSLSGTVYTYENSPLNRPQTITPAGLAYPSTYSYGTNTEEEDVLRDGTTTEYEASSLRKVTTTDANGNHLITFTDKLGRQVLNRRLPSSGSTSDRQDTYTVYDGKGRVRHVLPPGASTAHIELIYSYEYSGDDQVIRKLMPGRGWTDYSYNTKRLLRGFRDANLRNKGQWYVYKYDQLGRLTSEGFDNESGSYPLSVDPSPDEPLITTTYGTDPHEVGRVKTVRTKILNGDDHWLATTNHFNTCGSLDYQTGNNHLDLSANERTDYVYDGAGNVVETTYGHRSYDQGLTNVTSEHHYDFAGRAYRSYFKVGDGPKVQLNELAFNATGQLETKYQGGTGKSGTLAWLQKLDYTYLDNGMLQGINLDGLTGSTQSLPVFYDYERDVHDPNPGMPSTVDMDAKDLFYLELYRDHAPTTNSYTLPARRNGDITAVATQVRGRSQHIWGMTYDGYDRMRDARFYERSNNTATASYSTRYRESVTYDKRGNISKLDRQGMYVYPDYWKYKQIDRLTYSYKGSGTGQTNQLHHIIEDTDDNLGYRERSTNYDYDANGNLKYDVMRNADIEYNHLNLPVKIAYRNGTTQRHEFIYDASGNLLTRLSYGQTGTVAEHRLDYAGGIEYYNLQLNTVQHEEGRVYLGGGGQRYDYVLADHLGNNRLLYSDLNGNGIPEVSENEIINEAHYYPFGMAMTGPWIENNNSGGLSERLKYQYNGIEAIHTYGLSINMARHRTLDPITGRWWQVDPKADFLRDLSPYNSMNNSPVVYNDPNGDIAPLVVAALIGAAIGGTGNAIYQYSQGNTSPGEVAMAFGIGAVAGAAGAAAGSFAVAGSAALGSAGASISFQGISIAGYSLGTTGAVSGAVSGAIGGFVSNPIRQAGNAAAGWQSGFSGEELLIEVASGAVLGGLIGGGIAAWKGQNLLWGNSVLKANASGGSQWTRKGLPGDENFELGMTKEVEVNGGKSPFRRFSEQKQFRHLRDHKLYKGGSYFESLDDARSVAEAIKNGHGQFLGNTPGKGNFPIFKVEGVTGFNHNAGAGFLSQPTNVFVVKGTSNFSIVPYNPNF